MYTEDGADDVYTGDDADDVYASGQDSIYDEDDDAYGNGSDGIYGCVLLLTPCCAMGNKSTLCT